MITPPPTSTPPTLEPTNVTSNAPQRNTLALIALLVSLLLPLGVAINLVGVALNLLAHAPKWVLIAFLVVGGPIAGLGLPGAAMAVILGHVALVIAKRYPRPTARRWMAITALILGYAGVLLFVGTIAVFTIPYLFK